MDTNGHYSIYREGSGEIYISALICKHCGHRVRPLDFRQPSDRSGQPRYNRARAVMVKHLHDKHRDKMDVTP